jgi:hypothetical protein
MCAKVWAGIVKARKNKVVKKRVTWTFQPDDDVRKLVEEYLKHAPGRGEMTRLLNQAVRMKHKAAIGAFAKAAKILGVGGGSD